MNFVKAEVKKWSLLTSYLWDGTDANTVDERTLQNLTFLWETKNGGKKGKKKKMKNKKSRRKTISNGQESTSTTTSQQHG